MAETCGTVGVEILCDLDVRRSGHLAEYMAYWMAQSEWGGMAAPGLVFLLMVLPVVPPLEWKLQTAHRLAAWCDKPWKSGLLGLTARMAGSFDELPSAGDRSCGEKGSGADRRTGVKPAVLKQEVSVVLCEQECVLLTERCILAGLRRIL